MSDFDESLLQNCVSKFSDLEHQKKKSSENNSTDNLRLQDWTRAMIHSRSDAHDVNSEGGYINYELFCLLKDSASTFHNSTILTFLYFFLLYCFQEEFAPLCFIISKIISNITLTNIFILHQSNITVRNIFILHQSNITQAATCEKPVETLLLSC